LTVYKTGLKTLNNCLSASVRAYSSITKTFAEHALSWAVTSVSF